jgi:hypothetical protein
MEKEEQRKPFPVRLNDEEISKLDDIRRLEPDIPTRSEMLRRLIWREADQLPAARKRSKAKR